MQKKRIAIKATLIIFLTGISLISFVQKQNGIDAIYSGVPWFDDKGNFVSAHGACIVKDQDRFFLFGEKHSDTSNAFAGFTCYSSKDLYNWKFERVALSAQSSGKLGPNRVGERPKVMKCPATGEYVMYMHVDTLGYVDQFVGYATSKMITGPYTFYGPLLFNGRPILKWDMGTFQDSDGSGYVLIHGGAIYKLNDDYKSIKEEINQRVAPGFESPALFWKDSIYYFLGSHLTSWERNDNEYYTATSLRGPWTHQGNFAPKGTLTWNAQTTFVLPIAGMKGTTYMFMGDRWSFPKQESAAMYVWQPLTISGTQLSIPNYHEVWRVDISSGLIEPASTTKKIVENTDKLIHYSDGWKHESSDTLSLSSADTKGSSFSVKFKGTQVAFYGLSCPNGGYAQVTLSDSKKQTVLSSIVDMYCKYPMQALTFLSPALPKNDYTLVVTVMGERGNWSDKRKNLYGSTGYFVSIDKVLVK